MTIRESAAVLAIFTAIFSLECGIVIGLIKLLVDAPRIENGEPRGE